MATEVKERSVPKPVFTDAEAGAKEFPEDVWSSLRAPSNFAWLVSATKT